MLVVHTPKQNKTKTNPKSMTKTVCVLSFRKLPISPCFQSGLSLLSNRARGNSPKWRRQADGGRRRGPSLSSPSLAHCSASHQLLWPFPVWMLPGRLCIHPPGGAGGREGAMGKGLMAINQPLLSVELQKGACYGAPARAAAWGGVLLALGSCLLVQRMLQSRFPSAGV